MNSTAAICALVIAVVIGSLNCNAGKTELILTLLERRSWNKATSIGINLAIQAAKNSSDLKAFFDKYEIVIDGPYYTKVRFVKENDTIISAENSSSNGKDKVTKKPS